MTLNGRLCEHQKDGRAVKIPPFLDLMSAPKHHLHLLAFRLRYALQISGILQCGEDWTPVVVK